MAHAGSSSTASLAAPSATTAATVSTASSSPNIPKPYPALDASNPILQRIPLLYDPRLAPSLILLNYIDQPRALSTQHSLQPSEGPSGSLVGVRYAPNGELLQLRVPIGTDESYFNKEAAEDYGKAASSAQLMVDQRKAGKGKNQGNRNAGSATDGYYSTHDLLESMVYKGGAIRRGTNTLIGFMEKDGLRLIPYTATITLRPHLDYLDLATLSPKEADQHTSDEDDDEPLEVGKRTKVPTARGGRPFRSTQEDTFKKLERVHRSLPSSGAMTTGSAGGHVTLRSVTLKENK